MLQQAPTYPYPPSSQTWEQDVSVGGENAESEPARLAQAVSVQGIATVRNVPTIGGTSGRVTVSGASLVPLLGKTPQRRRVTIVSTVTAYLCASEDLANRGPDGLPQGMPLPANVPVAIHAACPLLVWMTAAGTVGFFGEVDLG